MELNQWQLHYPFAEQASLCFEREKKSIYCWTRSRPTWTFGESNDQVRDKSESKYQRVQDKSETIEKRLESGLESETGLEYYSPTSLPFLHYTCSRVPFLHSCSAFYSEVSNKPTEACLAKTPSAESELPSAPRPLRRPSGLCTTPTMRSDSNNPKNLFDRESETSDYFLGVT